MDKLQGTIIYVLSLFERPLYRTEIVKFIYMIDEMYFRHFGNTITGMNYKWDKFGPNSVDDGIVNEAEKLVTLGIVHMSSEPNQYGTTSYLYKLERPVDEHLGSLSDGEKYVIRDITFHYQKYTLQQLINTSKQTASFKGVEQGSIIELKKSKKYQEIVGALEADEGFVHGVEAVRKEMVG